MALFVLLSSSFDNSKDLCYIDYVILLKYGIYIKA